jgi:hypothetical protein
VGWYPSPTLRWSVSHFSHHWKPSPLQAHCRRWLHYFLLWLACLFTVRVGSAPPLNSNGAFHTKATVPSLPLSKHTGRHGTTSAFSGRLVYLQFCNGVPLPHSQELREPGPLCYVPTFFFFFSCLFIIQFDFFLFFPWVAVSLSRGYADLAQGCLWEYRMPLSSPGGLLLPSQIGAGIWWHGNLPGFLV